MKPIDLRSDTVTQPTPAMRRAMAAARVGDDYYGEDPTIAALERLSAKMLGKQAGLFVPSGVMGNQVAIMAHTKPSDEIVIEEQSHIANFELAGSSRHAGVLARTVRAPRGILTPALIEPVVHAGEWHTSGTALLCIENPHNCAGGTVWSEAELSAISRYARARRIPVHMDGARIFNAAASLGISPREVARHADSVMFCLSKGLCAPVGSVVVGSHAFVHRARAARLLLGGAMRQAGVLAAAGIVGLQAMVRRLPDDHRKARAMADALAQIPGIRIDLGSVQSSIVLFDSRHRRHPGLRFVKWLATHGVRISYFDARRLRIVAHHDVSWTDVRRVIRIFGLLR